MARRGRPRRLNEEQALELKAIVEGNPTATLGEIQSELLRRTGVKAHVQTIQKSLREVGVERVRGSARIRVKTSEAQTPRYGYTDAHRRMKPEQTYPSCLTDEEWRLVEDLFDTKGGRGTPPRYSRRALVDACLGSAYRLRLADVAESVPALAERLSDLSSLKRTGQIRAYA